jgi:hypothetical protein
VRIRSVLEEYEAKLEPPPTSPYPEARGKAEWKVYSNGTRQAKASASRLDLPDGAVVELVTANRRIASLTVEGGMARYRRESERGEDAPLVEVGQVLEVVYGGQVILAGRFYAE